MKTKEQIYLEFYRITEQLELVGLSCMLIKHSTGSISVNLSIDNFGFKTTKSFDCMFDDRFVYKGSNNKTYQQVLDELHELLNQRQGLKQIG